MVVPFKKSNKFSLYCSIADAAVEWQGLSAEQIELVLVDPNGMPYLAGVPDLADRADAILEAAQARLIKGHTHTEDGDPRKPAQMQLLRDSVNAWMSKTNTRIATPPPEIAPPSPAPVELELLTTQKVLEKTGLSRSTLIRQIERGEFPEPTHPGKRGNRWRAQVVQDYIDDPKNADKG